MSCEERWDTVSTVQLQELFQLSAAPDGCKGKKEKAQLKTATVDRSYPDPRAPSRLKRDRG